jgi:hypothetical protein
LDSAPVQRALWTALDEWSTFGIQPPASQVPTFRDKTLVPPDQGSVGFPSIPHVTYTGLKTTRYRFNYGKDFYQTFVPTINPPVITPLYEDNPANGPIYPSFVPKTDSDGNDIVGIRLPELVVPLATYTGWGLRPVSGRATDARPLANTFRSSRPRRPVRLWAIRGLPCRSVMLPSRIIRPGLWRRSTISLEVAS